MEFLKMCIRISKKAQGNAYGIFNYFGPPEEGGKAALTWELCTLCLSGIKRDCAEAIYETFSGKVRLL